jgi:hypothetical protein
VLLRRSIVLAGLLTVGCDDEIASSVDANVPADAAPSGDAVDAAGGTDVGAGFDGGTSDVGAPADVASKDAPPLADLSAAEAAVEAGTPDAPPPDAAPFDAPAPPDAPAATDAPVVADAPVAADVPATADVPAADVPAVADAGTTDVPATTLPPAPAAAPGECSAADRAASPGNNVDSDTADSQTPAVVWTGAEFGVAWSDLRHATPEIYFARFRDATTPRVTLPTLTRVTTEPAAGAAANEQPSIAWDGARYWIAWSRVAAGVPGSIRVASVTPTDATDSAVGAAVVVSAGTQGYTARPSLIALPAGEGGGLAVAWEDDRATDNAEIYFARLGATGARVGAEVRVTNADNLSGWPRLVHGPAGELALAWIDERDAGAEGELYFARLTLAGARPAGAADVRLTSDPFVTAHPALAYDGAGYGVAWDNEVGVADRPAVFFARLDALGARRAGSPDLRLSSNVPAGPARHPALAWNGTEYLALWQDERPTHTGGDLVLQRVSAAGARVGVETFLFDDADLSQRPALVWGSGQFLVAWEDDQYSHRDIWYRRILPTECRP